MYFLSLYILLFALMTLSSQSLMISQKKSKRGKEEKPEIPQKGLRRNEHFFDPLVHNGAWNN